MQKLSSTSRASRIAAKAALEVLGWSYVGRLPEPRRAVCLAVPHTDNLDGVLLVLLAQSVGLPISWMIKDTWFKPPMGALVRRVGGIPIDRSKPGGLVEQMIEAFAEHDELYLVIPPEGTRKRTEYWKSGFYRIALGADVPVVPGFLDYRTKTGGFGPPIELTGDVRTDMDAIRRYYEGATDMARHPEKFGPVRLREEMEAPDA